MAERLPGGVAPEPVSVPAAAAGSPTEESSPVVAAEGWTPEGEGEGSRTELADRLLAGAVSWRNFSSFEVALVEWKPHVHVVVTDLPEENEIVFWPPGTRNRGHFST